MPVPTQISKLVPYLSQHAGIIKATPAAFGVLPATANDLDVKAKALSGAYEAALAIREQSKGATEVQREALAEASAAFAACVEIIRGFANTSPNPAAVLAAAQIDPITPPTPQGPPSPVSDIQVGVEIATGKLVISWKASNTGTAGTSYVLTRRLPGATVFSYLGVAPGSGLSGKKFTDATLPAGTDYVEYSITPLRSGLSGQSTTAMVRFGSVGGQTTAAVVDGAGPAKMAA